MNKTKCSADSVVWLSTINMPILNTEHLYITPAYRHIHLRLYVVSAVLAVTIGGTQKYPIAIHTRCISQAQRAPKFVCGRCFVQTSLGYLSQTLPQIPQSSGKMHFSSRLSFW